MKQPNTMSWEEEFDLRWSGNRVPEYKMFQKENEITFGNARDRIKDFFRTEVIPQSQSNLIDQVIEWCGRHVTVESVYTNPNYKTKVRLKDMDRGANNLIKELVSYLEELRNKYEK